MKHLFILTLTAVIVATAVVCAQEPEPPRIDVHEHVGRVPSARARVLDVGVLNRESVVPAALEPRYSGRTAPTFGILFSLQAARHQM